MLSAKYAVTALGIVFIFLFMVIQCLLPSGLLGARWFIWEI